MIIWDQRNGYRYEDETDGKRYAIYEMMCYRGKATSDCLAIWDEEGDRFVNHVYGATYLDGDIAELNKTIKQYVDEYKNETPKTMLTYPLTKHGIEAWSSDVIGDILDRELTGDYILSHRNRQIKLPDLAYIHECIEVMLRDAEEEANQ